MQPAELYDHFLSSAGISTDTRRIEKGRIFFALKGPNFNGNLFAEEALQAGAKLVVADEKHFRDHPAIVMVNNALETLQQLARYHRKMLNLKIVAICGSNGKTTTKELMTRVLARQHRVYATKGNLNNHIGVPLTLLEMQRENTIGIVEIGANHAGETMALCEIAMPDYGLITNNGKDHLEGYGTVEGVRRGNGELYQYLRKNNGLAFVCADQHDLMEDSKDLQRVTYGASPQSNYSGKLVEEFPYLNIEWLPEKILLSTQLAGSYNFQNVMAAVATGAYFGVEKMAIQSAVASYVPSSNRSQIVKQGSNVFLLDAYNANPTSMQAALDHFTRMPAAKKILILGDMLELGSYSEQEHRQLISVIDTGKFSHIIFVGKEFKKALNGEMDPFLHFETVSALKSWFEKQHFTGYNVLLKGSRGIGLEKLLAT